MNPLECRYTREHEWVRLSNGNRAHVGITDYAQEQLGDVVFLNLPPVGSQVRQFQKFGEVESVKAVSDLFSPVSGQVIAINQVAVDSPELVNREPYVRGWLIEVELADLAELDTLMTADEYDAFLAQGKGG